MKLKPSTHDAARCPLCGGHNRCTMATEHISGQQAEPCWCVSQSFSADLLARVPAEAQRKACICAHCVNEDQRLGAA